MAGGVGHLKRICKDAFCVAGTVQETCSSEMLGGPGADFLRGAAFWSIGSSGLLKDDFAWDRCSTSYDLASLFRGRRSTLDRWRGKKAQNALVGGQQLCTQLCIFEGSLVELLRFWWLSSSKIAEVSQTCCVFDVVKFENLGDVSQNCCVFDVVTVENGGSLAE